MRMVVVAILSLATLGVAAQGDFTGVYNESITATRTGMYVLGGWAAGNIAAGAYGWAAGTGTARYFGQMNMFWNVINLTIAGFGLYGNQLIDPGMLPPEEMQSKIIRTGNLFLINGGLDIGYIGAGLLMRHFATRSANRHDMLKGYGNAVIMQGAFLLVFDVVMYGVLLPYRSSAMEAFPALAMLNEAGLSVSAGLGGVRLIFNF